MDKIYDHKETEKKWYDFWEEKGFFKPNDSEKTFSIILPPPNANGKLHIGHAMYVIEDIMVRYHRMLDESTLWLPGADHAGILTQVVYERELEKTGKTRHDIGREEFNKQTYDFTQKNKKEMYDQLRAMGFSLDWSKEKFTLDSEISKVVYSTFKKLYDDGLIYRGTRMINWCPRCATVLSDLEVIHKEKESNLWFLKYPIKDSDQFVTVATTRPETMLGDTAVAVNPEDKRYKDLVGKTVVLPLMDREIPIIADAFVAMEFGTGMVKITPAHDPNDYEIGQHHKLDSIQVVGLDDKMTDKSAKYSALDKYVARKQIISDLEEKGLVEKTERLVNNIGVCERCSTVIEPQVSKQWFVAVNKTGKSGKNLAKDALAAVKTKKIQVIPERFEKIYYNWMENIHDWCISRQLWWGHQIPVWYKIIKGPIEIKYFVHGTTVDNEAKKSSGHWDVELSALGEKQIVELKDAVANQNFDIVFCSDLQRAKRTAEVAFGSKATIISDKRLREIDYGELTRADEKTTSKLKTQVINQPFPKGESYKDVENRVRDLLEEIANKYSGKKIAFVAHQGPQLALDVLLQGYSWEEAFAKDWRNTKSYQHGWDYKFEQLTYVGVEAPNGDGWVQDPDTLDTWFSSGQWPFTTLGYGQKDDSDFKKFYPTSVMETGYDILFFWVARMIMLGIYVTDKVPFETVYLHGLVRDEKGQKMSKSKGNAIDPLIAAEQYGADAVRMALVFGTGPGNDANIGESKIKGMRNFTNKLWNIGRYVLDMKPEVVNYEAKQNADDKLILDELNKVKATVNKSITDYRFSQAAEELYEFVWHRFADKYIESSKERRSDAQPILEQVLEESLRLLHPFMPYITEELWQRLPNKVGNSIMVSKWPR